MGSARLTRPIGAGSRFHVGYGHSTSGSDFVEFVPKILLSLGESENREMVSVSESLPHGVRSCPLAPLRQRFRSKEGGFIEFGRLG